MAKGAIAKENLMKRVAAAIGADFIGYDTDSKKYYAWSIENGERMPVAMALTVPKALPANMGAGVPSADGSVDFEAMTAATTKQVSIDAEEQATLDRLIEELGL